jgi:hypothetical protein
MVMKKITFSADADLLELADQIAKEKGTTLENEVRQWLNDLGAGRWKPGPGKPKKVKTVRSPKR